MKDRVLERHTRMMHARAPLLAAFVSAVALLQVESVAQACSGCSGAAVAPEDGTVMPVNAVGVRWHAAGAAIDDVVLLDVEANVELAISSEENGWIDLRPAQPLEPNKTYRFEFPGTECGPAFSRTYSTGPSAELVATELGALMAEPPVQGNIPVPESVTCTDDVDAVSVRVELELDPQLEPFADVLMYETLVDGERWAHDPMFFAPAQVGRSWVGRGVDVIFATCPNGNSDGVSIGPHQVQMRAQIPGLPGALLESDIIEIVLECETPEETGEDDADSYESGDFVVPVDEPDPRQAGCGCSSADGRSPATLATPLLLLLALRRSSQPRRSGRAPTQGSSSSTNPQ